VIWLTSQLPILARTPCKNAYQYQHACGKCISMTSQWKSMSQKTSQSSNILQSFVFTYYGKFCLIVYMINRIMHAKIHIAWYYQPSSPISALGAFGSWTDVWPLRLICYAIWILACIIPFLMYLSQIVRGVILKVYWETALIKGIT
jgi:hypothetical protein